jgi:hypothetical protein
MNRDLPDIPNVDLDASIVPQPNATWCEIGRFALTYNGYKQHNSLEACGEIANDIAARYGRDGGFPAELSLDTLRSCLFFEQRRWRHFGEAPDDETMAYVRALIDAIRMYVT